MSRLRVKDYEFVNVHRHDCTLHFILTCDNILEGYNIGRYISNVKVLVYVLTFEEAQ